MIDIKKLTTQDSDFQQQLGALLAWDASSDMAVVDTVRAILADVKDRGNEAVLEYSRRFDRVEATSMADLE
jgi:histidinol dehydrogenase